MTTPHLTSLVLPGTVIEPSQLMGLDASFLAMDMISLAYSRLLEALPAIPGTRADIVGVLDDAWSMVDNANRLQVLLRHVRGIKQSAPPVKDALKALHQAEPLRNMIQHLPGELAKTAQSGRAVWGEVYWSHLDSSGLLRHHFVSSGTQYPVPAEIDLPAPPADLVNSSQPEFVWLLRHTAKVHLSDIARSVNQLRPQLEGEVVRALDCAAPESAVPSLLRLRFSES